MGVDGLSVHDDDSGTSTCRPAPHLGMATAGLMDLLLRLSQAVPRASFAIPLLLLELSLALVLLILLAPAIFMHRREPFTRIMALLELVLVRSRGRGSDGDT